jgi:glycerophosphoryl diester phosphodiesterase
MRLHIDNYKFSGTQQAWTFILSIISAILVLFLISSCNHKSIIMHTNIDVQGHRGCRGLRPENTISAFKKAVDIGVNTLELDVVVNKFNDVIISHEPFFNHEIATGPNGEEINEENEREFNMYSMTLEEIHSYDVGLKLHPRFLTQKKVGVKKPTLREMVTEIEAYVKLNDYKPLSYNIEIKRVKEHDGIFHPEMKAFADIVCKEIKKLGIAERSTVQCFDIETLQYVHTAYPEFRLVLLIMNTNPFQNNLQDLGFSPWAYSPYFMLVSEDLINYCRGAKIKVIPWTVNEEKDIIEMLNKGVDGIISDYPDRVVELIDAFE